MATFYRKYRPQKFSEVLDQKHIKSTLEYELAKGQTAHAYLFCGPRAIGKTTLARILAKSLNCQNRSTGQSEPCGICDSCRESSLGNSLDIIEIDAASHTGVDNVRENIIALARTAPLAYSHKVFIIDEAHMLSTPAFNALLKILEEPPQHSVFILCTTEVHKVPLTVISRCQRFDFHRIGFKDIVSKLKFIAAQEGLSVSDEAVFELVARRSEGHMRDAESIFGQVVAASDGKHLSREALELVLPISDLSVALEVLSDLARKDSASAIAKLNQIIENGANLKKFGDDLLDFLRKALLYKNSPSLAEKIGVDFGEALEERFSSFCHLVKLDWIILVITKISQAVDESKQSYLPQLPFELVFSELCLTDYTPTADIAEKQKQEKIMPAASAQMVSKEKIIPVNLSLEEYLASWPEVVAQSAKANHSLSFVMKACTLESCHDGVLTLKFKHKFHCDRLKDEKLRDNLLTVLRSVYKQDLAFLAVLDEVALDAGAVLDEKPASVAVSEGAQTDDGAKMIESLMKNFGGRLIS